MILPEVVARAPRKRSIELGILSTTLPSIRLMVRVS